MHGQAVAGATFPVPIWHEYMAAALWHHKELAFELPDKYPAYRSFTHGNYGSLGYVTPQYDPQYTAPATTTTTVTTTAQAPAAPPPATPAPKPTAAPPPKPAAPKHETPPATCADACADSATAGRVAGPAAHRPWADPVASRSSRAR